MNDSINEEIECDENSEPEASNQEGKPDTPPESTLMFHILIIDQGNVNIMEGYGSDEYDREPQYIDSRSKKVE